MSAPHRDKRTINTAGHSPASIWPPLAIFCLALLVRITYLLDSADYPAFNIPIIDARGYDEIARQLAAGEPMSIRFFWQPFFYPAFLATAYRAGFSILGVKIVQIIVGALTCGLTCALGARLFGRRAGLIAGAIVACHGPLIFYEAELLAAGWATLWGMTLLMLLITAATRPTPARCLVAGIVGGLAVITRPTFLPFLVAATACLAWKLMARPHAPSEKPADRKTHPPGRPLVPVLAIVTGFALVTLPVSVLNSRVTGHFGFLPGSGGINVFLGNHPEPCKIAKTVGFEWDRIARRPLSAGITAGYAQQDYFYRQTWRYVVEDPLGQLNRLLHKTLAFFGSRELPRNVSVYVTREWSALQTALTWKIAGFGFPFGLLLPLAVVGLLTHWRQVPATMWLFLTLYPAAVILVFVTARYRIPIIPALAVLAGAGCVALVDTLRRRRLLRFALLISGIAILATLISLPGPFCLERTDIDTESSLDVGLGHYYAAIGDDETAVKHYRRELLTHPNSVPAHTVLASLLVRQGLCAPAMEHYRVALAAQPDVADTHLNVALALRRMGHDDEALDEHRAAVRIDPNHALAWDELGIQLDARNLRAEAVTAFHKSTLLDPRQPAAYFHLGLTLARLGEREPAIAALRAGLLLDPNAADYRCALGHILQEAGHLAAAETEYRRVLQTNPRHTDARALLSQLVNRPTAQ